MAEIRYYKSVQATCIDGKVRAATPKRYLFDGSLASDTAFSCPAFVRVSGHTVRGFIRGTEGTEHEDGITTEYVFHAYTYLTNFPILARKVAGIS